MQLDAPNVRVLDAETCDFGVMPRYDTASLIRAALPHRAEEYLHSPAARRLIRELGVEHRHLTHVPGLPAAIGRLTALELAQSAVERLAARRAGELARLDALIFVSTSNPSPCNSQAALLACRLGLQASCFDLKAGCSGGLLGLMQGALMISAGCRRVLVVMAENLSQLAPADELRMLLTVGDGAACVLLERVPGPGFVCMMHGTDPRFADTMAVRAPFPPPTAGTRYAYEFSETNAVRQFLHGKWRALFAEIMASAGLAPADLAGCFVHQTHGAQLDGLAADFGLAPGRMPNVVRGHGNMGTPGFAVALAQRVGRLQPGERYLMQAVGGGVSWCAIVAEHR
jgi:3-oxoacyl-[acyl-carrier-protein] synthase-3